jgi:hypothetical protein
LVPVEDLAGGANAERRSAITFRARASGDEVGRKEDAGGVGVVREVLAARVRFKRAPRPVLGWVLWVERGLLRGCRLQEARLEWSFAAAALNCSASVEPSRAAVSASPPVIAFSTSSK